MNQKQTFPTKIFKYLLALPTGFALLLGNTIQASEATIASIPPSTVISIYSVNGLKDVKQNPKTKKPYRTTEALPTFPGGEVAMQKFIMTNLRYPVKAQEGKIQGRVVARFLVDKNGAVKDIEILRKVSSECDAEVIRVIRAMPKWNPATNDGRAVDAYFTIPFMFRLENDENEEIDLERIIGVETISVSDVREEFIDIEEAPKVKKIVEPFMAVEQMPSFVGGDQAMQKFIKTNLIYPVLAQELDVQGRVVVRFVVDVDGTVTNAKVLRGIHILCDREAIRLVNSMPKWNPGKQNGKVVPVYYTIPIVFKLDETEEKKAEPIDTTESGSIPVEEDFEFPTDHKIIVSEKPQVGPYKSVEQMPSFPGGDIAVHKFIATNLKYPVKAVENNAQGVVVARFVINEDGTIKEIEIMKRLSPECDAEVVRVIKSMPKWIPGKEKGKEVSVYYTLPVVFRL